MSEQIQQPSFSSSATAKTWRDIVLSTPINPSSPITNSPPAMPTPPPPQSLLQLHQQQQNQKDQKDAILEEYVEASPKHLPPFPRSLSVDSLNTHNRQLQQQQLSTNTIATTSISAVITSATTNSNNSNNSNSKKTSPVCSPTATNPPLPTKKSVSSSAAVVTTTSTSAADILANITSSPTASAPKSSITNATQQKQIVEGADNRDLSVSSTSSSRSGEDGSMISPKRSNLTDKSSKDSSFQFQHETSSALSGSGYDRAMLMMMGDGRHTAAPSALSHTSATNMNCQSVTSNISAASSLFYHNNNNNNNYPFTGNNQQKGKDAVNNFNVFQFSNASFTTTTSSFYGQSVNNNNNNTTNLLPLQQQQQQQNQNQPSSLNSNMTDNTCGMSNIETESSSWATEDDCFYDAVYSNNNNRGSNGGQKQKEKWRVVVCGRNTFQRDRDFQQQQQQYHHNNNTNNNSSNMFNTGSIGSRFEVFMRK